MLTAMRIRLPDGTETDAEFSTEHAAVRVTASLHLPFWVAWQPGYTQFQSGFSRKEQYREEGTQHDLGFP